MTSPTSRTLNYLRRDGYQVAVVEKWVPRAEVRSDLWRFADVLAVHPVRREFLLVQVTTRGNMSSRLSKSRVQPELAVWLETGGRFEVHGWAMVDGRWSVKRIEVLSGDVDPVVLARPPRKRRKSRWQPGDLFAEVA